MGSELVPRLSFGTHNCKRSEGLETRLLYVGTKMFTSLIPSGINGLGMRLEWSISYTNVLPCFPSTTGKNTQEQAA